MAASSRFRKRLAISFVMLPVLIFVYVTVALFFVHRNNNVAFSYRNAGTDLTFASSSGHWAAEEDLIRGRHFEHIVRAHELYKIHCHHPEASLMRTKPRKKPWNWAFWFDNYRDVKWRVPYVANATTREPEICETRPATAAELATAEHSAHEYMAGLIRTQPALSIFSVAR